MFLAQTGMELRLLVRNGEQVMLTLVIPLLLLFFFNLPLLYSLGGPRIDFVVPSILALAVMSPRSPDSRSAPDSNANTAYSNASARRHCRARCSSPARRRRC